MNKLRSQKGFSVIEAVIIVVIVLLIVGAGYFVYTRNQNRDLVENTNQSLVDPSKAADVAEAPEIKKASDLDAAERALDANDPELSNSDLDKMDQELNQL